MKNIRQVENSQDTIYSYTCDVCGRILTRRRKFVSADGSEKIFNYGRGVAEAEYRGKLYERFEKEASLMHCCKEIGCVCKETKNKADL